jgi:thioredoxin 1
MAGEVKHLKESEFDEFVKSESKVLVDFYADWCGPCQVLGPVVEETAKELKDKVVFAKVNVDDNQELAQRFQVMSIPTILYFKDGQQAHRTNGAMSKEDLIKEIEENL